MKGLLFIFSFDVTSAKLTGDGSQQLVARWEYDWITHHTQVYRLELSLSTAITMCLFSGYHARVWDRGSAQTATSAPRRII